MLVAPRHFVVVAAVVVSPFAAVQWLRAAADSIFPARLCPAAVPVWVANCKVHDPQLAAAGLLRHPEVPRRAEMA